MAKAKREIKGKRGSYKEAKSIQRKKYVIKGQSDIDDEMVEPDWSGKCIVCGASPIMPVTGMCGPCTFGEADTINGDW